MTTGDFQASSGKSKKKQAAKKANAQTWLWKYLGYVLSKFDFFSATTDVIILYGPCMGHDDGDSLPGKQTPH